MAADISRAAPGAWPLVPAGRVSLLAEDPDLGRKMSPERFATAARDLTVPTYRLARGPLAQMPESPNPDSTFGFLILSGLLMREVTVAARPASELLGQGDMVCPWMRDAVELLPRTVSWIVAQDSVLADLGGDAAGRLGGCPEVLEVLMDRSLARAEAMALQRSVASHVRVDVRLLAYLWHVAERWGVVLRDGVRIDAPLTHATLARMVGARRPTVTTALQRLMQLGYLRRDGTMFVVLGDPGAIRELESRSPSAELATPPAQAR